MLKALNLPPSELSEDAKQFIASGTQALVTWAPEPGADWTTTLSQIAWAKDAGLRTLVAVSSHRGMPSEVWQMRIRYVLSRCKDSIVIIQNEPDYAGIPVKDCAAQIRGGTEIARQEGHPHLLICAAATAPYALRVMHALRHWSPPVGLKVGWAHHHYRDVRHGRPWAVRMLLAGLRATRWDAGPKLWLTEGGYIYRTAGGPPPDPARYRYSDLAADERAQLLNVTRHYRWCERSNRVALWANYEHVDSLWGGWASGLIAHGGTPHPLHERWKAL